MRNIAANKLYSTINLIGLAIGMCVFFFCAMFVHFELSYDSGNQKADRLYRLAEENVAYADPSIFSLFTIPLASGDPSKVLESPSSIVLSETAAYKYFGQQPATGKILVLNGRDTVHVTGVMRDMPVNSHFRTDYLLPVIKLGKEWDSNWKRFFFYTYLELGSNPDIAGLNSKITRLVKDHTDQAQSTYELFLEPLRSVYLDGKPRGTRTGTSLSGSRQNVYIISLFPYWSFLLHVSIS